MWRLVGGSPKATVCLQSYAKKLIAIWPHSSCCFGVFGEGLAGHDEQSPPQGTEEANAASSCSGKSA